jgi:hypothetical protein
MKTSIKILTAMVAIILVSSFKKSHTTNFIGSYGVSSTNHTLIKLTINQDGTFYYHDYSNLKKKIIVIGNWTVKYSKVVLKGNDNYTKFHNVWSFNENGQVAKSRKGLNYYRLCKTTE